MLFSSYLQNWKKYRSSFVSRPGYSRQYFYRSNGTGIEIESLSHQLIYFTSWNGRTIPIFICKCPISTVLPCIGICCTLASRCTLTFTYYSLVLYFDVVNQLYEKIPNLLPIRVHIFILGNRFPSRYSFLKRLLRHLHMLWTNGIENFKNNFIRKRLKQLKLLMNSILLFHQSNKNRLSFSGPTFHQANTIHFKRIELEL